MSLLLKMIFRPFLAVRQKTQHGDLLDSLQTYKLIKTDSTPWIELVSRLHTVNGM